MPTNDKKERTKVTVEEVEETKAPAESPEKTEAPDAKTPKAQEKVAPKPEEKEVPKVTSFSLVDTPKSADAKEETENKKGDKKVPTSEKKASETPDQGEVSSDEVREWLKDIRPDKSKENVKSRKPFGKIIMIIAIVAIVLGAVGGGIYYYKTRVENTSPDTSGGTQGSEETTPTQTMEPTATPEPTNPQDYTISVLNGSGIPGEAGKAATALEDAGFTDINTGNADSYDYTTTIVAMKESVGSSLFDTIKESLSSYKVEQATDNLTSDAAYDIIVTLGSSKAE